MKTDDESMHHTNPTPHKKKKNLEFTFTNKREWTIGPKVAGQACLCLQLQLM